MLKSKKHVFWEALVITVAIFLVGLFLGMLIETSNTTKISDLYTRSEISLVDGLATSILSTELHTNCEVIRDSNVNFASKIYEEARALEQFEAAGKLTDSMKLLHKKYDLLRTILWTNNHKFLKTCDNYDLVVYLYEYETEDNNKKATQAVWSRILLNVRSGREDILLLPIATDQGLTSLDLLIEEYNITQIPAVIINNKQVIYDLKNQGTIESLLK